MEEPIRLFAFAVLVFGILLLVASLFADPLAIGMPGSGFGWKQITGTATGIVLTALGVKMTGLIERDKP